ncbi:MAG: OmpA family protein, partial [Bacteroidetes bacterium]|nr:OmpA family protein [Bacteroidota bacterium]
MKKHLAILLLFFFAFHLSILAQNECFRLHLVFPTMMDDAIKEAYTDGDSIATAYFKKCAITLLCDGKNVWKKQGDTFLASYDIVVYDKGKIVPNKSINSWAGTQNKLYAMPEKIVIENIKGGRMAEGQKILFDVPSVTIYRSKNSVNRKLNWPNPAKLKYEGKILIGKKEQKPLNDQKVILKDDRDVEVQTTITNKFGDFSFSDLNAKKTYKVVVPYNGFKQTESGELIIARLDGSLVAEMVRSGNAFSYELLPAEIMKLSAQKEEDTELVIRNFGSSKQNEMIIFENIYYDLNSTDIKRESSSKLDKIIAALKQNPGLKISVLSHTDSQGDDAYNLTLSQTRAEGVVNYFISNGIKRERLTAKGMGETQPSNRCINNVDCSET